MKTARELAESLLSRIDDLMYADSLDEVESIIIADRAEVRRECEAKRQADLAAWIKDAQGDEEIQTLMAYKGMPSYRLDAIARGCP